MDVAAYQEVRLTLFDEATKTYRSSPLTAVYQIPGV
jgi:hypothetical protein